MLKITVNSSGLKRRLGHQRQGVGGAARAAVIAGADAVVDQLESGAPRDTNRYIAGWVSAAVKMGGRLRLVPAIVRGRFAGRQLAILEKQIASVQKQIEWRSRRMERWFENPPPRSNGTGGGPRRYTPWARAERRRIYSLINLLERAKEQFRLADNDGELFLFIGKGYGRRLATVRTKVYGGTGSVSFNAGRARARIRNLEPHVKIVESRMSPLANAEARAGVGQVVRRVFEQRMGLVGVAKRA